MNQTMVAFLTFHASTLLRRAVLTVMAMQIVGPQIEELRDQFMRADKDGNGTVSRDELANFIKLDDVSLKHDVQCWFNSIFDSVDSDGSQEIDYTEWIAGALQLATAHADEIMRAAFRVFDLDGSGKISQAEFARVVKETPSDIAHMMPEFDIDGDGELSFQEFKAMIDSSPVPGALTVSGSPQNSPIAKPRRLKDWWQLAKAWFGA